MDIVKGSRFQMESYKISRLSRALRKALNALDDRGRMSMKTFRAVRCALNGSEEDVGSRITSDPEKYIGPFDSLTPVAQRAIVRAIEKEDRWRMRGYEIGNWHIKMARMCTKLRWKLAGHDMKRMSRVAQILALAFRSGASFVIHKLYMSSLRWKGRFIARQTLSSLLSMLGVAPWTFAVCYARAIPQLPGYRGFYHDESRHNTYGVMIGVDLLPASEGYYYIESNMNFGMSQTRSELYLHDPLAANLIDFAADFGFRNLVIVNNAFSYTNEMMAKQCKRDALTRNIRLSIVEDVFLPPRAGYAQSHAVPLPEDGDTLIVRSKYYHTSFDYLLQHKHASARALRVYQQRTGDPEFLLPETAPEPVFGSIGLDEPFPNVVYKLPERDEGKGVIFLKARSQQHAYGILGEALRINRSRDISERIYSRIEDRNGLYQAYVRSPLLAGRKLYKIRAHVLITPIGVKFLSAHRVIGRYAVPEYLPFGVVWDRRPYLVNLSTSSHYESISPEEEPAVVVAALAVAKGFAWAATYGFEHRNG